VCHGYFISLTVTRYWGIVTDPGSPRVNRPQIIIWVGQILTFHLDYVAGYTCPLLFLFERTHNYYLDNQGLVPWRLRRLGGSKVRSASLVKVLSDGKISCHGDHPLSPLTRLGLRNPRKKERIYFNLKDSKLKTHMLASLPLKLWHCDSH